MNLIKFPTVENFWAGYTDQREEGVFLSADEPALPLDASWPAWGTGEPNGDVVENCLEAVVSHRQWNDVDCGHKRWFFCQLDERPIFRLRGKAGKEGRMRRHTIVIGLCYGSIFDLEYTLSETLHDEQKYVFHGFTDSIISYDAGQNGWILQSLRRPQTYATTPTQDYPLGGQEWTVYNDLCGQNGTEVVLNLNACDDDDFNCADGSCIPMREWYLKLND